MVTVLQSSCIFFILTRLLAQVLVSLNLLFIELSRNLSMLHCNPHLSNSFRMMGFELLTITSKPLCWLTSVVGCCVIQYLLPLSYGRLLAELYYPSPPAAGCGVCLCSGQWNDRRSDRFFSLNWLGMGSLILSCIFLAGDDKNWIRSLGPEIENHMSRGAEDPRRYHHPQFVHPGLLY